MLNGLAGIGSCPLNAQDGRGGPPSRCCRVRGLSDHTACRTWARLDRYTGIAGGGAWIKGKPRPAHFIRPKGPSGVGWPADARGAGLGPIPGCRAVVAAGSGW